MANTREELEYLAALQAHADQLGEEYEDASDGEIDRREFVFFSLVAAAASTFGLGARALAQGGAGPGGAGRGQSAQQGPLTPLGNGEPVSWTFQPYPGGTGALMEKTVREHGAAAFDRSAFVVEKWTGTVPTSPDDIAFLPAHRLSALLKERRITSTALTKIYLDRMKRLDPTLLCAVTMMEESAMVEAARADKEIAAGQFRGPLHGLPYGVKDLFSTKGVRTTWGSKDFENRVIDEDAEIVVRL